MNEEEIGGGSTEGGGASPDERRRASKLVQSALFSVIFATLFALLVILGYTQTVNTPSPMYRILHKQDNIVEQVRVMSESLDRTNASVANVLTKVESMLQMLKAERQPSSAEDGESGGADSGANSDVDSLLGQPSDSECGDVLDRIGHLVACSKDFRCVAESSDYPNFAHYVSEYDGSDPVGHVAVDSMVLGILHYADDSPKTKSVMPASFDKFSRFLSVSKQIGPAVDGRDLHSVMIGGFSDREISDLRPKVDDELMARILALKERNDFAKYIQRNVEHNVRKARHICVG